MGLDRAALANLVRQVATHGGFALRTALAAVQHNKLRASLTSLGILFGVASVIAMLAIGHGAEAEILEQMRLLGANNVVVTPVEEQKEEDVADDQPDKQVKKYTPGLTYADARAIARVVPGVEVTSAEIVLNTTLTREGRRRSGKVLGVDTTYFRLNNLALEEGHWFAPAQVARGLPVAIIGHGVRARFFTTEDPIGRAIKVGGNWLTVVGVLADRRVSAVTAQRLGIRDASMDVYVPVHTMLLRYRNRAQLTQSDIEQASQARTVTLAGEDTETESERAERTNRNQLDQIIVRVSDSKDVPGVAEVVRRMLTRRHNGVVDFEITVPELLLQQERRTKAIFNVVLGSIASISLLVGGIGIMNIMLASVLERVREIGVRRAVGATRREVLLQFLSEAVLISIAGGTAGIILGVAFSSAIEHAAGVRTAVSGLSVVVAFGVSFAVGLLFGIVPAYRAAQQDPVVCLRYE